MNRIKGFIKMSKSDGTTISRKMGGKHDGGLLLDVKKRFTSEKKFQKKWRYEGLSNSDRMWYLTADVSYIIQ